MLLSSLVVLSLSAAPASTPAAEPDWFASLYTGDGIELRADERVFNLYALLNAMGYDEAPLLRKHPAHKYNYHPVRREVRSKLSTLEPELKKQADAFFDAHPLPVQRYLAYVLTNGAGANKGTDLKGFDAILAKTTSTAKLLDLMAKSSGEYRNALKSYLTALDAPMARARKLMRVPENGPQSMVVMNLLETQDEVRGVMGDSELVMVVGPSDKPNVEGVVREFARAYLEPTLSKKAQSGWSQGASLLREAQADGAREESVGEYATALVARAIALKSVQASDAAYDKAAQGGYYGLKDLARTLDDGKPVEAAIDGLPKTKK